MNPGADRMETTKPTAKGKKRSSSPTAPRRFVSRITGETLALVLAGGSGSRLHNLTRWHAKPAIPFGGKYRTIDFSLSNCVNSDVRRIGILTQYKSHSLINHVQKGWSFLRAEMNEFIELLPAQQRIHDSWYKGTADAIYQNLDIIRLHNPEYVLILAGDQEGIGPQHEVLAGAQGGEGEFEELHGVRAAYAGSGRVKSNVRLLSTDLLSVQRLPPDGRQRAHRVLVGEVVADVHRQHPTGLVDAFTDPRQCGALVPVDIGPEFDDFLTDILGQAFGGRAGHGGGQEAAVVVAGDHHRGARARGISRRRGSGDVRSRP